jgi:hypothetical protein
MPSKFESCEFCECQTDISVRPSKSKPALECLPEEFLDQVPEINSSRRREVKCELFAIPDRQYQNGGSMSPHMDITSNVCLPLVFGGDDVHLQAVVSNLAAANSNCFFFVQTLGWQLSVASRYFQSAMLELRD